MIKLEIGDNDLTMNEIKVIEMYKDYNIYRTDKRTPNRIRYDRKSRTDRVGKVLYKVEYIYDKDVPIVERVMDTLIKNDPLSVLVKSYRYFKYYKEAYSKYTYCVLDDGVDTNKLVIKVRHFEEDLESKVLSSNSLRDLSDPFYHEYCRLINLRKAKVNFPEYKIYIDPSK